MQRTYCVTGSPFKGFRLKKSKRLRFKVKNMLLSSLLVATSHAYSLDLDCNLIELEDFPENNHPCELQNSETENIEEELIKHWKKSYIKQGDQFIDNEYN